jgi:uncharacterized membrane protein YwaF
MCALINIYLFLQEYRKHKQRETLFVIVYLCVAINVIPLMGVFPMAESTQDLYFWLFMVSNSCTPLSGVILNLLADYQTQERICGRTVVVAFLVGVFWALGEGATLEVTQIRGYP